MTQLPNAQEEVHLRELRALISEDHPAWPAVVAVVRDRKRRAIGRRPASLINYLRFLATAGVDVLTVDRSMLESYLPTELRHRAWHLFTVRRLYRRLVEAQLVKIDPTVGIPYEHWGPKDDRRLSTAQMRTVFAVLDGVRDHQRVLAARRDAVLFALGAWLHCEPRELVALTWGDFDLARQPPQLLRRSRGTTESLVIPACVAERIGALREALLAEGVAVVPEDAVIASLSPRIRFAWYAEDRALLEPVRRSTLIQDVARRYREAGVTPPRKRWTFSSPSRFSWFRCGLQELDTVVRPSARTVRRVPTVPLPVPGLSLPG